ncbi:hypothetical protein B7463_g4722, partial [Scytalidium lignicola]
MSQHPPSPQPQILEEFQGLTHILPNQAQTPMVLDVTPNQQEQAYVSKTPGSYNYTDPTETKTVGASYTPTILELESLGGEMQVGSYDSFYAQPPSQFPNQQFQNSECSSTHDPLSWHGDTGQKGIYNTLMPQGQVSRLDILPVMSTTREPSDLYIK